MAVCPAAGEAGEYMYMFGLTLQDATGELDAAVYDQDGAAFFWVRDAPLGCRHMQTAAADTVKQLCCHAGAMPCSTSCICHAGCGWAQGTPAQELQEGRGFAWEVERAMGRLLSVATDKCAGMSVSSL